MTSYVEFLELHFPERLHRSGELLFVDPPIPLFVLTGSVATPPESVAEIMDSLGWDENSGMPIDDDQVTAKLEERILSSAHCVVEELLCLDYRGNKFLQIFCARHGSQFAVGWKSTYEIPRWQIAAIAIEQEAIKDLLRGLDIEGEELLQIHTPRPDILPQVAVTNAFRIAPNSPSFWHNFAFTA